MRVAFALMISAIAATLATAEEPTRAPASNAYKFSGGERIKLIVPTAVGEPIEQLVSEDGFISLPTGGMVNIQSKTLLEAQAAIMEMLGKEAGAKRVFAAIALLEVAPRKIFVGGEVKSPQALNLPAGGTLTLAAALASAGGPTPESDLSHVRVVKGAGPDSGKVSTFDMSQLGKRESSDLGPALHPGDVVTIPRGDVYILAGEVTKAGTYSRKELGFNAHEPAWLSRVLYAGGGLKPTANKRALKIIRTTMDGSKQVLSVNLDSAIRSSESSTAAAETVSDPPLQNGDIILADAIGTAAIIGKVKQPGVFPMGGETMKLTRLIAMAGGFSEFAKTSSVTVIRASAPKSPIRVDVGNLTKSGDLEKDLDLQDGDLVFVGERMF